MAVDPLQTWKDELEALPPKADPSWAPQFAKWYADRIVSIETDPSALVASGFTFTFNEALFAAGLTVLPPTLDQASGILGFATAWEAALLASLVVVGPGSFIPPSTPATLFSVVITSLVDVPSISLGKLKLLELVTAPPTADAQASEFPEKFRDATLLLTMTVTGTNSVVPPGGPNPLVAPLIPLT